MEDCTECTHQYLFRKLGEDMHEKQDDKELPVECLRAVCNLIN